MRKGGGQPQPGLPTKATKGATARDQPARCDTHPRLGRKGSARPRPTRKGWHSSTARPLEQCPRPACKGVALAQN
ncbi:hypothetical protein B296_00016533 [Ensete ventricosum]|uniref:Uncharacterized protein n=1 Tax=Ensete ventricosum TaxID=4639 RepID=A0A427AG11_ENSVE|nr:hypothetical protein B296_00016533 [Ensete ventricosum]